MKILVTGGAGYIGSNVAVTAIRCGRWWIRPAALLDGISSYRSERRTGDPSALISDSSWLRSQTGWALRYDDLDFIIRTAWEWELQLKYKAEV